ncbi:MAG: hypothetical protein AAB421_01140 [Patescibacteria group bacterium]
MDIAQFAPQLLWGGIGAIVATGLFAIIVVLVGGFNEFTVRALASTFVLGYYCLTMVATFGQGPTFLVLSTMGAMIAGFGLLLTLPVIWARKFDMGEATFKIVFSLAVVAFGLALGCINFRMAGTSPLGVSVMMGAVATVAVVTLMMLSIITNGLRTTGEGFMRVLIALAILMVMLSILNPVIGKMA